MLMLDRSALDKSIFALVERGGEPKRADVLKTPTVSASAIVAGIRSGDSSAIETLGGLCRNGIRYFLTRELGPQGADDIVCEILNSVVAGVRRGDVLDPERLVGFVRTATRRKIDFLLATQRPLCRFDADLEGIPHSERWVHLRKRVRSSEIEPRASSVK